VSLQFEDCVDGIAALYPEYDTIWVLTTVVAVIDADQMGYCWET